MSEILLAIFALVIGFNIGYVVNDYRRWSSDYEAWHNAITRRQSIYAVEA
jgi:hypothetical protein